MNNIITRADAVKVLKAVDAGLVKGLGRPIPGEMCVEAAVCYALGQPHGDRPVCVAPALRDLKIGLNDAAWSSDLARSKGMRRIAIAQLGSAGELDENEFLRRVAEMTIRIIVPEAIRTAAAIEGNEKHKDKLLRTAARCETEGSKDASRAAATAAYAATTAASVRSVELGAAATDAASRIAYAADAASRIACAAYAASRATRAAAYAAYAADAAADDAIRSATYATTSADAATAAASYAAVASRIADAARSDAYTATSRDVVLAKFAEAVVQILIEMHAPGTQWLDLAPLAS